MTTTIDLAAYMSGSISRIMAKAYMNVLSNPREAKFAFRMQQLFAKSEKRRKRVKEQEGIEIPPFLICSIATTCNLHCKGCYARANGIAADSAEAQKTTLSSTLAVAPSLNIVMKWRSWQEKIKRHNLDNPAPTVLAEADCSKAEASGKDV